MGEILKTHPITGQIFTENNFINDKITKILTANYRNTPEVTELANRVLKFKNYYFGSVDKESHYLIKSTSDKHGVVSCLQDKMDIIKEVNVKTAKSTNYAILVLCARYFRPLKKELRQAY